MTPIELAKISREAYSQHTHESGDNQALVKIEGGQCVVAFRGTQNDFGDILTDMRAFPWYSKRLGALCHSGFLKSTQALYGVMWSDVISAVKQDLHIHFTGHSLGGAQATVFTSMALSRGWARPPQISLTCFGSPPVQYGRGLDKWLKNVDVKLYRNGGDCVPRHPLLGSHVRPLIEIGPLDDDQHRFLDHRINDYIYNLSGAT